MGYTVYITANRYYEVHMIKTFTDGYNYHRYRGEIWESIDG